MKKIFIFLCLILSMKIYSQDIEENIDEQITENELDENLIISNIKFNGLKRTKESYLQKEYEKYIGKTVGEFDKKELETQLQVEGIFESYEINLVQNDSDKNTATIQIDVNEKITFIPLPFAMVSSSGASAGLIVMDTNAFGIKNMFMVGGFYSTSAITGMAMYSKPPKQNHIPGFTVFTSASKNEQTIHNIDNEEILEYKNITASTNISLNEKITKNNTLRAGIGFHLMRTDLDDDKNYEDNDETFSNKFDYSIDKANTISLNLGWNYSKQDWNGWYLSETNMSINDSTSINFGLNDKSKISRIMQKYDATFSIQHPIFWDRLRIIANTSGSIIIPNKTKYVTISSYLDRSNVGVTIIPPEYKTTKVFGATTGLEFAIAKFKYGMLSVYGKYEAILLDNTMMTSDDEKNIEFCHGPNGGVKFYLSKIAFPAFALGLSYNIPKHYFQFAAAVGISM